MGEKGNMSAFGYRREISKYEDIDEDELLASLTPEELKELERELDSIEPDQNLPVGQRQKSLTEKSPTGNFSREALMAYWEEETRNLMEKERLGECKEKRSNDENSTEGSEEEDFIECTSNTSDEVHTEDEEEESEGEQESDDEEESTQMKKKHIISGGVEATDKVSPQNEIIKCNGLPENEVIANGLSCIPAKDCSKMQDDLTLKAATCRSSGGNPTVLDDALENITVNDPLTSEVNLNNIDNITTEMLARFSNALKENTVVKTFNMANTHADDNAANAIANMLQVNRSITSLNIESNFITGKGILAITRALKYNNVLTELRFHNQRHIMGSQVEMEIAKLLKDNTTVVKLGYHFELSGPRMAMTGILTRNMDKQRQKRMQEQRELGGNGSANLRARVLQKGTPGSSPYASPLGSPWSSPKLAKKIQLTNNLPLVQLPPTPPPPPPPPPAITLPMVLPVKKAPTRNIAKVIKQHEKDKKKFQNGNQKRKGKKSKKKPDNILEEIKKSLRSISEKTAEETSRPSTPHRSVHDDLMAAIRDSSLKQLKPVGVPKALQ